MSRSLAFLLGLIAVVWLSYVTWLTGYRAGFDDGASKAWSQARATLAPHLTDAGANAAPARSTALR